MRIPHEDVHFKNEGYYGKNGGFKEVDGIHTSSGIITKDCTY